MDELRENRGSSWWRFGRAQSELYRAIPRHGFCAADLPRESARYRSLLAGQPDEAVQHGFPRASQTFDTGRRQRSAQLAHLGRLGYIADPACTQTVLQRQLRCRSDQYGLRTGCDDHRHVPVAVSMGTVRTSKAAVRLHTLLDLRGNIPAFIHITNGKTHEVNVLDTLSFEAGAFYVMDRGYLDFSRLFTLHQSGAFFVIRAKRGMNAHRVYSMKVDRSTGIICDQRIVLGGFYISQDYPEQLRSIRFKDPETGKTLVFLTNNTALPALTIAVLYKNRWQVELFFKWIKQHLRIKRFIGNSENAVKTQIWCAVATYVLIAIVKKELQIDASLYTLLQILSVSVFEKNQLRQVLFQLQIETVII